MGLINDDSLYPVDTALSGNEQLIGSDSDTNETTKQYKLSDILAYVQSNISVDGLSIDQNNIIRIVPVELQIGSDYNIATLVNSGNIEWEYSEEVGNTGQIDVKETWNVVFRVPVIADSANIVQIQYDYYWLINQGKGVIGSGSGVTLEANNFLKMPSSGTVSLPNDNNLNPPVVYVLSASDITSPHVVLNDDPGSYSVNSATADTYFIMQEIGQVLIPVPDATKIYRFVGSNGTYGDAGVDTSVLADFVLVDSSALESNSVPSKKPNVRTINVAGVIDDSGGETIKTVVDATLRGDIVHVPDEILFITANRLIENSDNTYRIMEELYVWGGALGDITTGSTLSDFQFLTAYPIIDTTTPTVSASPNVVALANADINAPEDAVNASDDSYVIDGSADFVFIIYDANADSSDYKIYKFVGANSTYGSGGTTAVPSDFNEITQLSPGGRPIRKTSQLKNDGEDGTSRFIELDEAGLLKAANEGLYRSERNEANFGDVGGFATDVSHSLTPSSSFGATGFYSFSQGLQTTASGSNSSSFGQLTVASGSGAFAAGASTTASGPQSTSFGQPGTIASGKGSFAHGSNIEAYSFEEVAFGQYPTTYSPTSTTTWSVGDRLFVIANGTGSGARSNALIVYKNGRAEFGSTIKTQGYTVATLPATPTIGDRAYVTDANAPTFRATVAGGGSNFTPVIYDGAKWICA